MYKNNILLSKIYIFRNLQISFEKKQTIQIIQKYVVYIGHQIPRDSTPYYTIYSKIIQNFELLYGINQVHLFTPKWYTKSYRRIIR